MNTGIIKKIVSSAFTVAILCGALGTALLPAGTVNADAAVVSIDAKHFPDKQFRKYVSKFCDLNGDKKLSTREINKVDEIDVEFYDLSTLKGIEYFTYLSVLYCHFNNISNLDLSKNTNLTYVECHHNKLISLDVGNNKNLIVLDCSDNRLTKLDISRCTALKELSCGNNKISSLDVSKCKDLESLGCANNKISALDVSKCTRLVGLGCGENLLTTLDVSKCGKLESLGCNNNKLTSLNISGCKLLEVLDCSENKLTELDISNNGELKQFDCSLNNIRRLDISYCDYLVAEYDHGVNADGVKYWSGIHKSKDLKAYQTRTEDYGNFLVVPKNTTVVSIELSVILWKDKKNSLTVVCDSKLVLSLSDYESKDIQWSSSNTDVATVEPNGMVTGKQAGVAVIRAKGPGLTVKCNLMVKYKDVTKRSDFWYLPTYSLTVKNVVKGYDKQTRFKPANDCTRAQMVTFLWRLAGCPKPKTKTTSFKDIKSSDYFYKPVLWAVENGITTGVSKTKFDPKGVCTRAQTVTFLWRMAGKPEPKTTKNRFKDVKADDYFYKATIWAAEKKIVAGYKDGTFKPQGKCLRRQMVTFLYKYNENVNKAKADPTVTPTPVPTKAPQATATPAPKPTCTPAPKPSGWGFGDNRDKMSASEKKHYDELIADGWVYGEEFIVDGSGKIVYLA